MVSRIHNDKLRTKQTFTSINYFLAKNKKLKLFQCYKTIIKKNNSRMMEEE